VCGGHSASFLKHISIFTDATSYLYIVMRANRATMLGAYSLGAADLLADLLSVARVVDIVGCCGYILCYEVLGPHISKG
jgi:hypothetical protein